MDLKESKFHYAGQDMNFVVFSDYPCQVRYVGSIRLPGPGRDLHHRTCPQRPVGTSEPSWAA
jgi:hypothetical protein